MDEVSFSNERDSAICGLSQEPRVCRQVFEALERLAAGKFGTCLQCAEPISASRLQALPWISLCLRCQGTADNTRRTGKACLSGAAIEAPLHPQTIAPRIRTENQTGARCRTDSYEAGPQSQPVSPAQILTGSAAIRLASDLLRVSAATVNVTACAHLRQSTEMPREKKRRGGCQRHFLASADNPASPPPILMSTARCSTAKRAIARAIGSRWHRKCSFENRGK